ncbi:sigma-70 family RNA polymerase sigma factor [Bradyrhizobium sp. U87765 SZCCT0131]|uniref:RNA polymerase sigma factor n=1 Tax=unclassified Bradyrhizobium TaxID=2631580 RepID=UPI001BAE2CFB|nr:MULTISPECIES: sigma-70 family RNA polymerase sigma factor [unclassified Bradyrhizobium]MBR1223163.1 sigma-70 family RNA polymerase sigma factor [Bradyrhizobium sp. U87765 SZCCT0131]MBR1265741.1 sigma-70 family RNA polymerase sigma factor [Bradyrhizobium sp. U87765 SZCCT0134]MBR1309288.1 sigma-70 family RNA polymerase sigma factor [Bradyrhizobium sp. U87765 SZCCT0110]MBR1324116.1 sigma-70 family RNA polymerase sigma factor [Bradyrhizobium sp. U87765 SZCCT0109]MBR1352549.1 sigma-70 family RNA
MAGTTWAALRGLLVDRYEELKLRLTRQLGSEELASESLHDTWLRLHRDDEVGAVRNPPAYLLRIAINAAMDRLRADGRRARRAEIEAALDVADAAPGPARETEARLEIEALDRAMRTLPERTRAILMASRLEGLTHHAIAERMGVSRRTVAYELDRAIALLEAERVTDPPIDCTNGPPKSSEG